MGPCQIVHEHTFTKFLQCVCKEMGMLDSVGPLCLGSLLGILAWVLCVGFTQFLCMFFFTGLFSKEPKRGLEILIIVESARLCLLEVNNFIQGYTATTAIKVWIKAPYIWPIIQQMGVLKQYLLSCALHYKPLRVLEDYICLI